MRKLCGLKFMRQLEFSTNGIHMGRPHEVYRILKDGNCFYRAICARLTGATDQHAKLRMIVKVALRDRPNFATYVQRLTRESVVDYFKADPADELSDVDLDLVTEVDDRLSHRSYDRETDTTMSIADNYLLPGQFATDLELCAMAFLLETDILMYDAPYMEAGVYERMWFLYPHTLHRQGKRSEDAIYLSRRSSHVSLVSSFCKGKTFLSFLWLTD